MIGALMRRGDEFRRAGLMIRRRGADNSAGGTLVKQLGFRHYLFVSTALAVGLTACAASAQENAPPQGQVSAIEEVVVTARRREENLQTTPVAITAVTAATLEARGVQSLVEISRIAPNMQIQRTFIIWLLG